MFDSIYPYVVPRVEKFVGNSMKLIQMDLKLYRYTVPVNIHAIVSQQQDKQMVRSNNTSIQEELGATNVLKIAAAGILGSRVVTMSVVMVFASTPSM